MTADLRRVNGVLAREGIMERVGAKERTMKRKWIVAAIGAALVSGAVWAQWGPGMMGGYGGGYGPGMMGGYGGGYGPGMMGGNGPRGGPGMTGGYGWGYERLDLTDAQRDKIASITKELRNKQWGLMQSMHELRWNSSSGAKNDDELRKTYDAMAAIRKEMFENGLDARKKVDEVLTKEQREELAKYQRRGW